VINKSTTTTITTTIVSGQYDYVANKKSKIFHLPFCSSVNSMNEENKIYHKGEREQLIANGYTPCKKCCP
jgi:DNA-entry nuclease